jgi:hypothetical protein
MVDFILFINPVRKLQLKAFYNIGETLKYEKFATVVEFVTNSRVIRVAVPFQYTLAYLSAGVNYTCTIFATVAAI